MRVDFLNGINHNSGVRLTFTNGEKFEVKPPQNRKHTWNVFTTLGCALATTRESSNFEKALQVADYLAARHARKAANRLKALAH